MSNRYLAVKEHVRTLAIGCGRDPDSIILVAVTKGHSLDEVLPAYRDGCSDFGENRLVEAFEKMADAPEDLRWHLIGTLQSNKVRKAVGKFVLIHSVDTPELAKKIALESNENGIATDILLQVNTSGEATKHGLTIDQWEMQLDAIAKEKGIRIRGLMTMGALGGDEISVRRSFASLREFRDRINNSYRGELHLEHLSMGMSADYPWAIAEGATILRIGSAIFTD
jgi:pyridoxal phosphate enzyme (YggS family)